MTKQPVKASDSFLQKRNSLQSGKRYYSGIFNSKQKFFAKWALLNFSDSNLAALKSNESREKDKWIRKEIQAIFDESFPDETIDPRRFVNLYKKGIRDREIWKTPHLPDSLYFILTGLLIHRGKTFSDEKNYLKTLKEWPDLFSPTFEEKAKKERSQMENEFKEFANAVKEVCRRTFSAPCPRIRTYEGFVFSASFLFGCLRVLCPKSRETQFSIFTMVMFKSLFNLCFDLPFEYHILNNVARNYQKLQELAQQQHDIFDGPFLENLLIQLNSDLENQNTEDFPDIEWYKNSEKYIDVLTQEFSQDRLYALAKELTDKCGDDCNGLIFSLIKQASKGLVFSERTEDKSLLTALLDEDLKNFPRGNLPMILYLIASGLNSYSTAADHVKTMAANAKKCKKTRS